MQLFGTWDSVSITSTVLSYLSCLPSPGVDPDWLNSDNPSLPRTIYNRQNYQYLRYTKYIRYNETLHQDTPDWNEDISSLFTTEHRKVCKTPPRSEETSFNQDALDYSKGVQNRGIPQYSYQPVQRSVQPPSSASVNHVPRACTSWPSSGPGTGTRHNKTPRPGRPLKGVNHSHLCRMLTNGKQWSNIDEYSRFVRLSNAPIDLVKPIAVK